MTASDLCVTPAVELAMLIRRRELSPVEITRAVVDRIERLIFKNLGKNLTHWERFVRCKIAGTQFTKCYSKTALLRGQMPR